LETFAVCMQLAVDDEQRRQPMVSYNEAVLQEATGDWKHVMENVAKALKEMAINHEH